MGPHLYSPCSEEGVPWFPNQQFDLSVCLVTRGQTSMGSRPTVSLLFLHQTWQTLTLPLPRFGVSFLYELDPEFPLLKPFVSRLHSCKNRLPYRTNYRDFTFPDPRRTLYSLRLGSSSLLPLSVLLSLILWFTRPGVSVVIPRGCKMIPVVLQESPTSSPNRTTLKEIFPGLVFTPTGQFSGNVFRSFLPVVDLLEPLEPHLLFFPLSSLRFN